MKAVYLSFFLLITLFGCAKRGYVPHYIVTDSKEPKQESSTPNEKEAEDALVEFEH
jgi:hypothetical protein